MANYAYTPLIRSLLHVQILIDFFSNVREIILRDNLEILKVAHKVAQKSHKSRTKSHRGLNLNLNSRTDDKN